MSIEIEVLEATERITLNAAELEIASVVATLADGRNVEASIETDEEDETAVFSFGETLPAGRTSLDCVFTGVLNDQLRGFYRSEYVDKDGEKRYMATTQFEATDARRAFPCWDEPSLKATFEVTLTAPKELTTLSNMPVATESVEGPLKTVRFQETPKMSTYLLAFVVGDLASVEATGPGGTLVRVFTTRGKEEQGRFALGKLRQAPRLFQRLLRHPLPAAQDGPCGGPRLRGGGDGELGLHHLPRDGAAVRGRQLGVGGPSAHHAGRLARDGAHVVRRLGDDGVVGRPVAQRELRLVDGGQGRRRAVPRMADVDAVREPGYQRGAEPRRLGKLASHRGAGQRPRRDPEIFDAISYSKGGSVLRMLEQYLGADTFRGGLRAYIDEHQYANARTAHLWNALEAASGEPVTRIMNS